MFLCLVVWSAVVHAGGDSKREQLRKLFHLFLFFSLQFSENMSSTMFFPSFFLSVFFYFFVTVVKSLKIVYPFICCDWRVLKYDHQIQMLMLIGKENANPDDYCEIRWRYCVRLCVVVYTDVTVWTGKSGVCALGLCSECTILVKTIKARSMFASVLPYFSHRLP